MDPVQEKYAESDVTRVTRRQGPQQAGIQQQDQAKPLELVHAQHQPCHNQDRTRNGRTAYRPQRLPAVISPLPAENYRERQHQTEDRPDNPAVIPGDLNGSPMILHIRGIYLPKMPKDGEELSEDDLHTIRMWISAGAKGE